MGKECFIVLENSNTNDFFKILTLTLITIL